MDNNNSQIRLNTGRFISRCFYEHKLASFMIMAFAVLSALSDFFKAIGGDRNITVIFGIGAFADILLLFFSVHVFFQGAKNRTTGFMELPIMLFEAFSFLYFMISGYIRISRIYSAEGFFQKFLAIAYAAYIILTAISCMIVLSFLKSRLIVRQVSSLIYFITCLGYFISIALIISYFLCMIFVGYTNDGYVIFSLWDTLKLGIAPLLFVGYWRIFYCAATDIEMIYERYYEKLLAMNPMPETHRKETESETEQSDAGIFDFDYEKENDFKADDIRNRFRTFDVEEDEKPFYNESDIPEWSRTLSGRNEKTSKKHDVVFKGEEGIFTGKEDAEEDSHYGNTDRFELFETREDDDNVTEKTKKPSSFISVLLSGVLVVLIFIVNLIPYIIKGIIYAAAYIVRAFGFVRYKLVYAFLLVSSDGKITSKKLLLMRNARKKCYDLSEKIIGVAEKIKTLKLKK